MEFLIHGAQDYNEPGVFMAFEETEHDLVTNFASFGFSYFPLNLGNPTFGPVFNQLYFRQAFQHLIDQQGWITKILGGYAVPTYGPVPLAPNNSFADSYENNNPYKFSVSEAASILKAHGWKEEGGVDTCVNANLCAPGDSKVAGLKLSFNLDQRSARMVRTSLLMELDFVFKILNFLLQNRNQLGANRAHQPIRNNLCSQ